MLLLVIALVAGGFIALAHQRRPSNIVIGVFVLALLLGITMTLPIGGADMPVVISLYNALTGLAVALRRLRAQQRRDDHRRHRRRFSGHAAHPADGEGDESLARQRAVQRLWRDRRRGAAAKCRCSLKPIEAADVGVMMAFAQKVIIVPGYGMAVAQAQHKVWELTPAPDRARCHGAASPSTR